MRRLRRASIILLIISLFLFGANYYRTNVINDKTGPLFKMDNSVIKVSVKDDEKALLTGLTAIDATDGDVSNSIIVESISPFTGTGHRVVNYAAFDSDNHVTHVKRELAYTDYEAARFHLKKQLSFPMNATNLLEGISVEDCIDGDLTKSVKMMYDEELDTSHVGEYSARLKVTNSAGGVSYLPVKVEIYDASVYFRLPQIKLKENLVYVDKGTDFDEQEYISAITVNGEDYSLTDEKGTYGAYYLSPEVDEKSIGIDRVEIDSNVDTDVSGYYEVVYSFEDTEFSTGTGKARLYVVVTEGRSGEK